MILEALEIAIEEAQAEKKELRTVLWDSKGIFRPEDPIYQRYCAVADEYLGLVRQYNKISRHIKLKAA